MEDLKILKNIDKKLSALLALSIASWFGSADEKLKTKPETILSTVGIETSEIALILGKKLDAVRKSIQRSKK
ncbi:MAG: hypothetical protein A2534_05120 [Candidatus Magasanikbacteria bacterium RIFOXYD2_FULL_39_9]|uniref:Uncharacterized protein n=1 Tax=Candidatus Magasanikbacteria bacterium RIFOXYD1_FULL_40_23 TaxID=1798705 RepID=A0A1F6P7I6_9BACT|nr:MAG: hypothetical protein A2534_05120 [Candidatus Magasanikbacteria bacterium RIFOXYD2_FULL_39_9]OGH92136.1 MAG: hypothetical protein A2563_00945 [Candidatus Magasanikbacteria bacterium RIFOXYD1_FULL_40_23]